MRRLPFRGIHKRLVAMLTIGVLCASLIPLWPSIPAAAAADNTAAAAVAGSRDRAVTVEEHEPYFSEKLQDWLNRGIPAGKAAVELGGTALSAQSDAAAAAAGSFAGKDGVLIWNSPKDSWIEYPISVSADGLYEIHVLYHPITGSGMRRPISWDVKLDGGHSFREASSIVLYRHWRDVRPLKQDADGNDIRPQSEDVSGWIETPLRDSGGAYERPLQWFFGKGSHTLRIQSSDPAAIEAIKLVPQTPIPAYKEAVSAYPLPTAAQAKAKAMTIQAENVEWKNDSAIQLVSDFDQRTVPLAKGKTTFNTIGGQKWRNQNQEITWQVEIPESGRYKLAFRALQNTISQKSSFRRIAIDGKVPFQELLSYRFPYSTHWSGVPLQDGQGEPYEFYLEKGTHKLTLSSTYAPLQPAIFGMEELLNMLQALDRDLTSLTGGEVDKNRTWKIAQELPDLPVQLRQVADRMKALSEQLARINGNEDQISESLLTNVKDIEEMLTRVDDIPYHADQIAAMLETVGGYADTLEQQPLQLDEIYVVPAGQNFPSMEASLLAKIEGIFVNFFYTFRTKTRLSDWDDHALNVWVYRGRDYVDLLQELADESFTPETGIKVNVKLLPNTQLLLMANAAGHQPDVALGLSQDLPVDYAIRHSVYDLSRFPDFQDVYRRYSPGSWLPLYYNKGYYAVPETQAFQVLYYRKDILNRLGLSVPDTWDDVYDMLPTLQQNHMNFYMPPKEFITFIYQNNAEFFDSAGGETALDSPAGYKAFKQWTDLYNIYALQKEVTSFYQHFRKGDMPIGFADYNMYIQLSAAAPELNGSWGIAQVPGTVQKDGTVARWAGGGQSTGVIFQASQRKEEAWRFLKWWTSAEIQEQYGSDLEAFNGVAFRWNTSNIEAFTRLPWKREDLNVILQQWKWYKDMPNVPGSYIVSREIVNAWNRTVIDGINYRSSLETTILDINRELRRKQQEFGFIDDSGHVLKRMELPVVDKPWDGVNPYVE